MRLLNRSIVGVVLVLSLLGCVSQKKYSSDISKTSSRHGTNIFKPDSASIAANYTIPDWFRDAKFGIFIHWGVYSVPAYGSEWYSRWMYQQGSEINKHHVDKYGALDKFGYKDFIPMFTAEKFDPNKWAEILSASGAKYVVPVAEHHDGFAMYDSAFNPWNSTKMGPRRDVIGELKEAVTANGLHFGLSSHRAENAWFYSYGMTSPSDVQDSTISLYGERLLEPEGEPMSPEYGNNPGSNDHSRKQWLQHTYELIDKYQPELMWFDWTVGKEPFQSTFYRYMAYYYNTAVDLGKEVVVNTKFGYGDNIQVYDIERGKSNEIRQFPWQTDTSIGKKSWSYCIGEENKTPDHIIDDFIDIVSKNGNLLLNIGPTAAGEITPEQEYVLREIGFWLKINSEAIYGSRPWIKASEGVMKGTAGYMTDGKATEYTAQDIRFTTNNEALYAMCLEWSDGAIVVKSLSSTEHKVGSVKLLGSTESISWSQTKQGLQIEFPKIKPCKYAYVFKIILE